MLASTAARTGGLCMACKQGIRQHIEAAKVYYRDQRQPDPFRDYWTALVHRVHDTPDGFYRLSADERTYYSVCVLHGEVYNGGMYQFFSNSGSYYHEALRGLEQLGATRCRVLLVEACRVLFPNGDPPRDRAERDALMPMCPDTPGAPLPAWDLELERIDDEFCTDPDNLGDRLRKYALDHQLVQI